jgi:hypothetical protein
MSLVKKFPICCTVPGPTFGDVVEGRYTHNPIPEGKTFETEYGGYKIMFKLDMHFYTHPDSSIIEVVSVEPIIKRPRLNGTTQ